MKLDVGEIVADKYRVDRLIGEGGMGTVYAATNQMTGRTVALKWLRADLSANDQFTERFMREARVAGRLDHPNIVNVYDAGRHADSLFLVMELLRGESFDEWLRRGNQPPTDCVAHLMPALRAVEAAHAIGIIHRDLKPENIFLCKDGDLIRQTKVLDFGIAKDIADAPTRSLTSPGSLVGTVHYMAPEQVRNSRYVDARSDVYAIGVILYYALGGGLPFESESIGELIIEIAGGTPEPLDKRAPHLPKGLVEIVMRAMARDPEARYPTVAHLGRALEPFAGGVRFEQSRAEYVPLGLQTLPEAAKTADTRAAAPVETLVSSDVPRRRSGLVVLVPTVLGILLLGFLSLKGGSWLLDSSTEAEATPAQAAPADVPAPEPPATPAPPEATAPPVAASAPPEPTAAPAESASASASETKPPGKAPATAVRVPRVTKPPAAAKTPVSVKTSASSAASSPPPTVKTAAPSPYEQNPYLRR